MDKFVNIINAWPILILVLLIFLLIGGSFIWWTLPSKLSNKRYNNAENTPEKISFENESRKTLSTFLTGISVAIGVIGAIVQFGYTAAHEKEQAESARHAEKISLLQSAANQLREVPASLSERLAGISSLSYLLQDKEFYWPSVLSINTYIRYRLLNISETNSIDVHEAFRVLSMRHILGSLSDREHEPFPLRFDELALSNLEMSDLWMWGADFRFANLSNAVLPGAKLKNTDFTCANLFNADFRPGILHKKTDPAEIGPALELANFRNAKLCNVRFTKSVNLKDACFEGADLKNVQIDNPEEFKDARGLSETQLRDIGLLPDHYQYKPCLSYPEWRDKCSRVFINVDQWASSLPQAYTSTSCPDD